MKKTRYAKNVTSWQEGKLGVKVEWGAPTCARLPYRPGLQCRAERRAKDRAIHRGDGSAHINQSEWLGGEVDVR
jgi:hypothetical protein